jgi:hypothetical protein
MSSGYWRLVAATPAPAGSAQLIAGAVKATLPLSAALSKYRSSPA